MGLRASCPKSVCRYVKKPRATLESKKKIEKILMASRLDGWDEMSTEENTNDMITEFFNEFEDTVLEQPRSPEIDSFYWQNVIT